MTDQTNHNQDDCGDCLWCDGYVDGFRVGPDGISPDGNKAEGYNPDLWADPEYTAGLSTGRSDRIDQQLQDNPTVGQRVAWPA